MYVDMDELKAEGDQMVGDDIAEEGIKYPADHQFRREEPGLGAAGRGRISRILQDS